MKPLIVANWKCNPTTRAEAKRLFNSVARALKNVKHVKVVICPPFIYLVQLQAKKTKIYLGAQDAFWEEKGAFTGEVSPPMLKDLGCQYVILGHSERRGYFKETDEIINKKLKKALSIKLNPILCIGESQNERNQGKTKKVLERQIKKALFKIPASELKLTEFSIAYEPIWAIGTGKFCQPIEAKKARIFIQKVLSKIYNKKTVKNIRVLYGGSANSQNAASYIFEAGFQGLLVGGASLIPQEFVKIAREARDA